MVNCINALNGASFQSEAPEIGIFNIYQNTLTLIRLWCVFRNWNGLIGFLVLTLKMAHWNQ